MESKMSKLDDMARGILLCVREREREKSEQRMTCFCGMEVIILLQMCAG